MQRRAEVWGGLRCLLWEERQPGFIPSLAVARGFDGRGEGMPPRMSKMVISSLRRKTSIPSPVGLARA